MGAKYTYLLRHPQGHRFTQLSALLKLSKTVNKSVTALNFKPFAFILYVFLLSFSVNAQKPVKVLWPLTNDSEAVYTSGIATASFNYGPGLHSFKYDSINGATAGGWDSRDLDKADYYEYKIAPERDETITFTNLNFEVSLSTVNMRIAVHYSLDDFQTQSIPIGYGVFVGKKSSRDLRVETDITVKYPQVLSIRIYGWSAPTSVNFFTRAVEFDGNTRGPLSEFTLSETHENVSCYNGNDGSIDLTVTGGTPPFTYSWSASNGGVIPIGQQNLEDLSGLVAGTYTVSVTDQELINHIISVAISQPASALTTSEAHSNVSCNGYSNGSIDLTVSGGTAPYIYIWTASNGGVIPSGQSTIQDLTGLVAGTYAVLVTDANGCTTNRSVTITQPSELTVSASSNSPVCQSGTLSLTSTPAGGTSPYTYSWSGPSFTSTLGNPTITNVQPAASGTYTVIVTDANGCQAQATTQVLINPTVVPSVNITANPGNSICAGTSVTFTATPTNGGTSPAYQWYVNNIAQPGQTGSTFTTSTLAQGNTVKVTMASSLPCPVPALATSNIITMTVNPLLTPSITINASATTICAGASVIFTAAPVVNGGTAPQYQWKVNGTNVGPNSATYTTTTLANGDIVTCVLTSNATCATPATVTSNSITITVNPLLTPSVSIVVSANDICPGIPVTFTASPVNGGSSPAYQWKLNGSNVGTNSPTYTSSTLANGDQVQVILTSNATCATPSTATSNTITMIIKPGTPATPGPITGNAFVCPNYNNLVYSIAPVNNATSYTWTVPAGWTLQSGQGSTSITVLSGNAGQNGNITVTATNSCGTSAASTLAVVVNPGTPETPAEITGPAAVCPGTTGIIYSIAAVANATTYTWTVPTGWTITAGQNTTSITVTSGSAGQNGNISVTAGNSCGTSAARSIPVTVNPGVPPQPGAITGPVALCPKTSYTYSIVAVAGASSYTWTVPAGWTITSGQGTVSITATTDQPGTGTVSVTANSQFCGSSSPSTLAVTVNPGTPNVPGAITGPSEVCRNTTATYSIAAVPNATTYNWTFPTGWNITSGSGTASVNVAITNTAISGTISVTASNSCGTSAASSKAVIVSPAVPATPATPTGLNSFCPPETVVYSVPAVPNALSYTWTIPSPGWTIISGAGTNSITVSINNLALNGNFNIYVRANNACGSSPNSLPLSVTVDKYATANAGPDQTICFNTPSITLAGSVGGGAANKGTWSTSGTGSFAPNAQALNATYSPSNADRTAGTVTLTLTPTPTGGSCSIVSDFMVLTIRPTATATISGSTTICSGESANIIFTGRQNTIITYTVNGGPNQTISLGNSTSVTLNTGPLTATTTYSLVSVEYSTPPTCTETVTGTATITVDQAATANAGPDQTICAGSTVQLAGVIGGSATSGTWSGGTGTFNPNATTLNAVYTPSAAEITAGTVQLQLTTNDPPGPCPPASDKMIITIEPQPLVNAGSDQTICEGSTVQLAGTIAGSAASASWSGGTGTFNPNANTLNAIYTPSAAEITTGTVTLTLTTNNPAGVCPAVSDQITITINAQPVVEAGGPDVLCESREPQPLQLDGAMISGSAIEAAWSIISGGGTLSSTNPETEPWNVFYTPEDGFFGTVILRLTSNDPDGPCEAVSDDRIITINQEAKVEAGGPDDVCQSDTPAAISLAGASFTGATSAAWSITSGGGILSSSAQTATPWTVTYTPAPGYFGIVVLTLTTNDPDGAGPCTAAEATRTINIYQSATVDVGADQSICSDETANITATPGGSATSGNWTTTGTGTFANPASLSTTYTPSYQDIVAGSVILTFTTNEPAGPCSAATDNLTLTITEEIIITTQPANTAVCITYPTSLSVVAMGDISGYQWYKDGVPVVNTANISGANSPVLSFNAATLPDGGNYYVVMTSAGECGDITSNTVVLHIDQSIIVTEQPASATRCVGESVTFTVTVTVERDETFFYDWYHNNVLLVNGPNVSGQSTPNLTITNITLADAGAYKVEIKGDELYTCPKVWSQEAILTVNENANIVLTSGSDNQEVCINEAIQPIVYTLSGSVTAVAVTGLPTGVSYTFVSGIVTISGTPTVSGLYNYTINATGLCLPAEATGTINVLPDNTITLTSAVGTDNQTVCINTAITPITYITTGATGATFSNLPAGVTGVWANDAITISGTPTVNGIFNYIITLTEGCGVITTTGTITVQPDNTYTLASGQATQTVCINTAITATTWTTTGATGITVAGLPSGVDATWGANLVTMSGTPTVAGIFDYTITLTGGCGTVAITGTITVIPENTIVQTSPASTNPQTVCIDIPIASISYTTTGATGATFIGLPPGVTGSWINNVISITGTPTAAGSFNYTVTLTGGCGIVTATGTINVTPNNTITLTSAPPTENQTICIGNPIVNITYSTTGASNALFNGLPSGVNGLFNSGNIVISGTPDLTGTFNYTIELTGGCGHITESGTILILPNATISPAVATPQTVCLGSPINNITFTTTGATGATVTGLPAGVTGSWAANVFTISGTPAVSGTFNYTVTTTGPCINASATGTIIVDPTSAGGTLSPRETIVCIGTNSGTITLTGHTGTIIRWETSTDGGITWVPLANTSTTYTYTNLAVTTLYRVVVQSGSTCPVAYSQFASVSVIPHYTPTATAAPSVICLGQSSQLSANANTPVFGFINGGGFNNSGNNGWATDGVVGSIPSSPDNNSPQHWGRVVKRMYYGTAPNGEWYDSDPNRPYCVVNGDLYSTLETPEFNLIGVVSPSLSLLQGMQLTAGATAKIQLSVNGGAYFNLQEYFGPLNDGNTDGLAPISFDLSQYIGQPSLKVRFLYDGSVNSGWAIDEVNVTQGQMITSQIIYQWTPTTYLTPATGLGTPVTATPTVAGKFVYTVTTTFTATTTQGTINCELGSDTVHVTVVPYPVVAVVNSCVGGGPVTFTQSETGVTGTWSVTGGGSITQTGVFTPTTPGCFTASYTSQYGNCADTESFVVFPEAPAVNVSTGCGPIVLTPPATIPAGFTVQYSFDNGATWGQPIPTADNCDGYLIKARYVTSAACGIIPAGTFSTTAPCAESPAVLRIVDNTFPTASNPLPVYVQCATEIPAPDPSVVTDEADNCTNPPVVAFVSDASAGTCPQVITRTYNVTDACNNTTSVTQIITVDDDIAPIVTPPAGDLVLECFDAAAITLWANTATATDNCTSNLTVNHSYTAPADNCNQIITVTFTATDACNNTGTATKIFTVNDDIRPEIIGSLAAVDAEGCTAADVPSPVTTVAALEALGLTVTDNCNSDLQLTVTSNDVTLPGGPCPFVVIRTYTITDLCGNSSEVDQQFTIDDNTPPSITCPGPSPFVVGVNSGNVYIHAGTGWDATASDLCSAVSLTFSFSGDTPTPPGPNTTLNGVTFNQGFTTVTWHAVDICGNANECTFIVEVQGNVDIQVVKTGPATITAGQNITYTITVTNNGPASAPEVTLTDNLPAQIVAPITWTLNGTPQAGVWPGTTVFTNMGVGVPGQQVITITGKVDCAATDFTNTASVVLSPPFIDPNLSNNTSSFNTAIVNPLAVTANVTNSECDNDGDIDITATGGTAPYSYAWTGPNGFTSTNEDLTGLTTGTYTVTVTDANGCTVANQWTVTSEDTEPPTFTPPAPPSFCVVDINSAVYDGQPEPQADIVPDPLFAPPYPSAWRRPDWYIFDGTLELDLFNIADNCCAGNNIIDWTIEFAGNAQSPITGTGQLSDYGPIVLWGTPSNTELTHTITYTVTDCNGNASEPVTIDIIIKPRPDVIKQ